MSNHFHYSVDLQKIVTLCGRASSSHVLKRKSSWESSPGFVGAKN